MSKLSNAIGANSVTSRVLECDVLQNKCSDWLNVMFPGDLVMSNHYTISIHFMRHFITSFKYALNQSFKNGAMPSKSPQ